MEGMSSLKKECDATGRQQEVLIRSDMDQIISSRALLEEKLRGRVFLQVPDKSGQADKAL